MQEIGVYYLMDDKGTFLVLSREIMLVATLDVPPVNCVEDGLKDTKVDYMTTRSEKIRVSVRLIIVHTERSKCNGI